MHQYFCLKRRSVRGMADLPSYGETDGRLHHSDSVGLLLGLLLVFIVCHRHINIPFCGYHDYMISLFTSSLQSLALGEHHKHPRGKTCNVWSTGQSIQSELTKNCLFFMDISSGSRRRVWKGPNGITVHDDSHDAWRGLRGMDIV